MKRLGAGVNDHRQGKVPSEVKMKGCLCFDVSGIEFNHEEAPRSRVVETTRGVLPLQIPAKGGRHGRRNDELEF
ncbi:MAG: hypothetical protein KDM64_18375 [Verrucomicrobiae bacterium]|nr:hypothetical protein [Verrucomicrobiae bacterium]